MANDALNKVFWHLRRAVLLQDGAGLSDGKLLGMFVDQGDEAAFEVLMRRHGPTILGMCRRILLNPQDAEDAVQATFLVLLRKASSIMPREMVGSWLYGVARQTATRMRVQMARRRWWEKQVATMPEPRSLNSRSNDDLLILDEELSRLPDKYRIAIILCDLQGKTRKQAAGQLGWAEGTVSSRLARGRTMLAKRLAKHGLLLSVEALVAFMSQNMASACLPPTLVSATVKAASIMAAGKTVATGLISPTVVALTEKVVKGMLLTKLKTMVAVLMVAGVLGTGIGSGARLAMSDVEAGTAISTKNAPDKDQAKSKDNETAEAGILTPISEGRLSVSWFELESGRENTGNNYIRSKTRSGRSGAAVGCAIRKC